MPINIDPQLPARSVLEQENIFVMCRDRAQQQDIRPLRIAILNLMPTKIETETQLLRLLSNTPLQVDIELVQMATHESKNTAKEHLLQFYKTFHDIKHQRFDGMIITGAPVEHLPFEQVDYWPELCDILAWTKTHVWSTFHICWGAQAGLYYHYGIDKQPLPGKCSGVFAHDVADPTHPLLRGLDDPFLLPHSRHTTVTREDIAAVSALQLLSVSPVAGVSLVCDHAGRQFFATGHAEYDRDTLALEYARDLQRGLDATLPCHYYPDNNPALPPQMTWRAAAHLLFSNWLNFCVYQQTPFDLSAL
ncbi:MAG: homoserine O-succinyltransferase [Oscillospiraceae bacterium]|nr:homoserine O-succinyltransferase [Oscillospiraceae bacterium]